MSIDNDDLAVNGKPRRPRRMAFVATGLLVVLLGGSLVLLGQRGDDRPPAAGSRLVDRACGEPKGFLSEGDKLPGECMVEAFGDGSLFSLDRFRNGKPMVLNFWASWCVFCIKEMPDFQRVYERVSDRVAFLGVDLLGVQAESRAAAKKLARETGVRYPLAYDEDGELYRQVSPRLLMPTTVFVRADGVIAYRQFGPLDENKLQAMIRKHLGVEVRR